MKYTIFTPTYNRSILLPTLFQSLLKQNRTDFEWLIVDDGSSDGTNLLVEKFRSQSPFEIRYFYQPNGGKHRAFNKAIKEAQGEWFLCVDSDDPLTNETFKNLDTGINLLKSNDAGFVGVCVTPEGELIETRISKPFYSDTIEIRDKYKYQCEPEIYRTSLLKGYSFPEFNNEKFITEAILFDRLTSKHPLLYTNLPLQIKRYLPGGLTDRQTEIRITSPNGTIAYYKQRYYLSSGLKNKLKSLVNYGRFVTHAKIRGYKITQPLIKQFLLALPLSLILVAKDLISGR